VALGDCAVNGNVPAMRNEFGVDAVLRRAYIENAGSDAHIPRDIIPPLLPNARPVHEVALVDVFIPGCPPSPLALLQGLLVAVGRLAERVGALSFVAGEETSK